MSDTHRENGMTDTPRTDAEAGYIHSESHLRFRLAEGQPAFMDYVRVDFARN